LSRLRAKLCSTSVLDATGARLTSRMTSPWLIPTWAAAEPGCTSVTTNPGPGATPRWRARARGQGREGESKRASGAAVVLGRADLGRVREVTDGDLQGLAGAIPDDVQLDGAPHRGARHHRRELRRPVHLASLVLDDDVAGTQAGAGRRRVLLSPRPPARPRQPRAPSARSCGRAPVSEAGWTRRASRESRGPPRAVGRGWAAPDPSGWRSRCPGTHRRGSRWWWRCR
jgi:hypothetical protein